MTTKASSLKTAQKRFPTVTAVVVTVRGYRWFGYPHPRSDSERLTSQTYYGRTLSYSFLFKQDMDYSRVSGFPRTQDTRQQPRQNTVLEQDSRFSALPGDPTARVTWQRLPVGRPRLETTHNTQPPPTEPGQTHQSLPL